MRKFFKWLLWILVALIFLATLVYLVYNSRDKAVLYEVVTPTRGDVERTTVLTGKIEPRDEIEIKPQIAGIISEILVEAGDPVKEGDVIAKIRVVPDESQLSSAQSRVETARINLNNARTVYERTKSLYEQKFESREKYEADLTAYSRAKEELAQAVDQLKIVREGVSASNAQGSNTMVRSTVTGLVLEVPVKVGASVIQSNTFNDGTTIAKVADMTDVIFKGKIDETEVDLLKEGMPVRIAVGAIEGSDYEATIETIAPMATEENGTNTFEVKAALHNSQLHNIRAGYSANATVVLEGVKNVLRVPERVIEFKGDSAFVYVLTSGKAPEQIFERVPVKMGISNGLDAQIVSGKIDVKSRLRGNEQKQ